MIIVTGQSTSERREETIQLFNLIKPLLDKGYSFNKSFRELKLIRPTQSWRARAKTREVVEYAKKQGYRI